MKIEPSSSAVIKNLELLDQFDHKSQGQTKRSFRTL